jgi:hypothetical protein
MSLRGRTIEQPATLPDGRNVTVHVGVPEDPYIPRREQTNVDLQLREGPTVIATVTTVLDPDDTSEALQLAREVREAIESGRMPLTAHALEPFADRLR